MFQLLALRVSVASVKVDLTKASLLMFVSKEGVADGDDLSFS